MTKRFISALLCILTILTSSALAESFQAVTPCAVCSTLKEASKVAGFGIDAPRKGRRLHRHDSRLERRAD